MKYKNGFFQIVIKENLGTFLRVYPPQADGESISINEVLDYLDKENIAVLDLPKLSKEVAEATEIKDIFLLETCGFPVNEKVILEIPDNHMYVKARFYPPSKGGSLLRAQDILYEMKQAGVRFGLITKSIEMFLKHRQYCVSYVVAKAKLPRHGHSASIEYKFDTKKDAKPTLLEDGTVDFHKLDMINHVEEGDLLAVLHKEDMGEPGKDVMGMALPAKKVERKVLKYGNNIELSEDGTEIRSKVCGHVKLEGEKVFVSNTYEVLADVDASTGDIEYDGNVTVKGSVRTGFMIRATGDINVNGVVEGAQLFAGGQIILQRGIQGMGKGVLEAKSNIIAKFIENSQVKSGGYVTAEAIMHSEVDAEGDITVDGKRGLVTGGTISSKTMVSVKVAGSNMGTITNILVGVDPTLMEECKAIGKELPEIEEEMEQQDQLYSMIGKKIKSGETLPEERIEAFKRAGNRLKELTDRKNKLEARLEECREQIKEYSAGRVKVFGVMYPGVRITIYDAIYYVREELKYCQLQKDKADVKVSAY